MFAAVQISGADFEAGKAAFAKGDFETALKEWQPLAEQGLPFAAYNVALLYARGQGVKKDPAEAAKWYRVAADKGIPEAQYNLGILYSTGSGVPRDFTQAQQWFVKAAEKGDANAANSLGTLYEAGDGTVKNYAEAEKWYRKSAEEGNDDAQFNLGVMYDIGHGVKVNFAEANKWYLKAADQWNEGALCNLGILYYNGDGVSRDLVQSHTYYLLAKEAGDPRAANLMQLTTEKLTKKQIAKAQEMAEQWKRDHSKQIALAKSPIAKPPSPDSVGPEVAGAYSKPVESGSPVSAAAPVTGAGTVANGPGVWTGVEHVVAIGDLHGNYRQFTELLRSAGLIGGDNNWSGGKAHLVQTGDVLDSGTDSRRIMDLLIALEPQARAAGGMVHCLLGNHEAMDVYGDLRFVTPAGYQEFAGADSKDVRLKYYAAYRKSHADFAAKTTSKNGEMPEQEWMLTHPLGFVEQREAFAPDGKYGKWILTHDSVIRINGTLYSHAGVSPKYAAMPIEEINRRVRDELLHSENIAGGIVTDLQGPLWFQGFAMSSAADGSLDATLRHFEVARQVVGHVDAGAAVTPELGNRVILIDVGGARQSCLVEQAGELYALHRGSRIPLPKDESADMLRYLKQAAALDPEPSPLAARIQLLQTK